MDGSESELCRRRVPLLSTLNGPDPMAPATVNLALTGFRVARTGAHHRPGTTGSGPFVFGRLERSCMSRDGPPCRAERRGLDHRRPDRRHAARAALAVRTAGGRGDLRQDRGAQPGRIGQGPRGSRDGARGRAHRARSAPARFCSTPRRATPASPTPCSAPRAGTACGSACPANVSPERKRLLRIYGADLVLTDPMEGSDGAIRQVKAIYERDPSRYYYPDQYSNDANWRAHLRDDGRRDSRADRRAHHALRRGPGHERHVHGHGPPAPQGEARRDAGVRAAGLRRSTASKA